MADKESEEIVESLISSKNVKFLSSLLHIPSLSSKIKSNLSLIARLTPGSDKIAPRPVDKVCQYCFTEWDPSTCKVTTVPETKPGKAMRKILLKLEHNERLSKVEKSLAIRHHSGNTLVIKCKICSKETKIKLKKPRKKQAQTEEVVELESLPIDIGKKKKKKKNKKTPILSYSLDRPLLEKKLQVPVDLTDDCVIDVVGDVSNFNKPKLNIPAPTADFIPLVSSTPKPGNMARKRKSKDKTPEMPSNKKQKYINPFAVKTKAKNRLSSLKNLLVDDGKKPASPSLKRFLSNL